MIGTTVRDTVTGFQGVVVIRAESLYGASRVCVQPQELIAGSPVDCEWFEVERVEECEPAETMPLGFK